MARSGVRGVASPQSPGALPHANPGAEPGDARADSVEGRPRVWRVVGLHQIDGMPHSPSVQDRLLGRDRAVGRREVLRNLEK